MHLYSLRLCMDKMNNILSQYSVAILAWIKSFLEVTYFVAHLFSVTNLTYKEAAMGDKREWTHLDTKDHRVNGVLYICQGNRLPPTTKC